MNNSSYHSMKDLISAIKQNLDKLQEGKMDATELNPLVNDSRELYERLVVLRFKALESSMGTVKASIAPEVKTEEKREEHISTPFKLNLSVPKEEKPIKVSQGNIFGGDDSSATVKKVEKEIAPKEIVELSLNDKLANAQKTSLAEKLQKKPIADLRSSIGLNQKFLFMNDLFEGENVEYNNAIEQLNNFSSLDDAKNYLLSLGTKYGWDLDHSSVSQFTDLVERRYA